MKKVGIAIAIALTLIVVLVAAWLGAAWHTGAGAQERISGVVERLNAAWAKNPAPGGGTLQIKQLSYERGLLSSHARLALTAAGSKLGNDPLVEYDVAISHGPFPLAALRRGQLAPRQFQAHVEVLPAGPLKMMAGALMGGKPPLVMDIGCGYGNHCSGEGSVPAIDADLGPLAKNAKLTFGGVQIRFDIDHRSDTDYNGSGEMRLLPLSIGGNDFGSGQITFTSDAQSINETIGWKTDRGASKVTLALAASKPLSKLGEEAAALKPEDVAGLIKSAALRLELSKPMAVDMAARAVAMMQGGELEAARQQMAAQFDAALTANPEAGKFIRTEGDLLISDWQYKGGKLTVNGQEHPEVLEQVKQALLARQPGAVQTPPAMGGGEPTQGGADGNDGGGKQTGGAPAQGGQDGEGGGEAGGEAGNGAGGADTANAPPAEGQGEGDTQQTSGGQAQGGGASGGEAAGNSQTAGSPGGGAAGGAQTSASPGGAAPAGQAPGGSQGVVRAPRPGVPAGRAAGGNNNGVVRAPPSAWPAR